MYSNIRTKWAGVFLSLLFICIALTEPLLSQNPTGPVPVTGGALPSTSGSLPTVSNQFANQPNTSQPNTSQPSPVPPSIPSLERSNSGVTETKNHTPKSIPRMELPSSNGQYWVEYDLRPYTQSLKNAERPQQAIIDWIIRETGSDVWFNEPFGILNADRSTLRVYHNANMQKSVAEIYEKFVNGVTEPQVYGLRLITVGNPNWRNKAAPLMRSAQAQAQGVQVWVMPKENGAIFMSQLRERTDVREMQVVDLPLLNGQSQGLEQLRSRNYLREYQSNQTSAWPPYTPVSGEIKEGYKLHLSPLMSLDGRTVDLMLKCEIDQVERLNSVNIDLPMPLSQPQSVQIDVPQLVSWRLHERFRWPANQMLLLSCGVVAAPTAQVNNTLLGGSPPTLFGLNKILPTTAGQRTDALLLIEHKGPASTQISSALSASTNSSGVAQPAPNSATAPISRGRY
ncbi:MAG: hypothetical protein ABL921_21220 [Pirellula sp.]